MRKDFNDINIDNEEPKPKGLLSIFMEFLAVTVFIVVVSSAILKWL